MMAEFEATYDVARAARHRLAGKRAVDPSVRCAHAMLARLYAQRARQGARPPVATNDR